jgi:hypothetical protein
MFSHGRVYGCIRLRDEREQVARVLKKAVAASESAEDVRGGVKLQRLGALCADLFSSVAPAACRLGFLPCCIYVLKQRPGQPALRAEDVVEGAGRPFDKRALSVLPPPSAGPEHVRDCHKFAAFQFFTFVQASREAGGLPVLHLRSTHTQSACPPCRS